MSRFMQNGVTSIFRTILVISIFCVMVFCVGCASEPALPESPELDVSLISDDPCAAPCWQNIIPGISSEEDVNSQLMSSALVQEGTLSSNQTRWGEVPLTRFTWQARGGYTNSLYLRDGVVLWIEIVPGYSLSLGQVVDEFGPPENVYAVLSGETIRYLVCLDYPSQGISFSSLSPVANVDDVRVEEGVGIISEELQVSRIFYYAPTTLEGVLRDVFLGQSEAAEYHLSVAQEWEGFGHIELADRYAVRW